MNLPSKPNNPFVQVSTPQYNKSRLDSLIKFYNDKHIFCIIRNRIFPKSGIGGYTLWRQLTDREVDEIESGKCKIVDNMFIYNDEV